MPTYGKDNFKESNVNYLNKDFGAIKNSLMNYAKSYFPNTYRDFNETSPGMMLLEMNAYVGDVLMYYLDHQFNENSLERSIEKTNLERGVKHTIKWIKENIKYFEKASLSYKHKK